MKIENLIRQCRIERKLGRLSSDRQHRIMRKVGRIQDTPQQARWGHLMGVLRQIHREVAGKRNTLIRARWEVFRTKDDRPIAVSA